MTQIGIERERDHDTLARSYGTLVTQSDDAFTALMRMLQLHITQMQHTPAHVMTRVHYAREEKLYITIRYGNT